VVVGTTAVGVGQALMVRSGLGLAPWEVLAQGVAKHTGVLIGTAGIGIALAILLLWIPLHQRLGVGTLVNPVIAGLSVNITLGYIDDATTIALQTIYVAIGTLLFGVGVGVYLGAGLGPGPRDGIMTGIAARGHSIRRVRTLLEVIVLFIGFALGGTVGVGTVVFALAVGPIVHFTLNQPFVSRETLPKT
jgi:uncharacterized membrane protein YczE